MTALYQRTRFVSTLSHVLVWCTRYRQSLTGSMSLIFMHIFVFEASTFYALRIISIVAMAALIAKNAFRQVCVIERRFFNNR
jgi:hypothetical protein